ncbi:hypothetical protein T06_9787 [Trichinella sp. T6]|nr:hypothetical protein T06_9787 [Trichinella sp. T6]
MADVSELHLVTGMDQLAAIVPKSLLPERVCTTTDFHHSPNRFSQRRTKVLCTELSKKRGRPDFPSDSAYFFAHG